MSTDVEELNRILKRGALHKNEEIVSELIRDIYSTSVFRDIIGSKKAETIWEEMDTEPEIDVEARDNWEKKIEDEISTLKHKISKIEAESTSFKGETIEIRKIETSKAEELIIKLIKEKKSKGKKRIDILEIIDSLKLPPEQIDEIMERLEERKVVKKIG